MSFSELRLDKRAGLCVGLGGGSESPINGNSSNEFEIASKRDLFKQFNYTQFVIFYEVS